MGDGREEGEDMLVGMGGGVAFLIPKFGRSLCRDGDGVLNEGCFEARGL